jgi:Xaa-Pro aminopeptidase
MTESERVATRISMTELKRRWDAVRSEMASRGIDALVMQNASDWLGGYVKWFTDVPAHNDYPRTVIFHRDDLMTLVEMGAHGRRDKLDGKDVNNPGIGEILYSPSFFSVAYTHAYDPLLVMQVLKERGHKTIGLLGQGALPSGLVDMIRTKISSAALVDASDFVDRIKAVKSAEEIALLRKTAAMQDAVFAKVAQAIKPGLRDCDLGAIAQYEGQLLGSEQGIFRGSSEPLGRPAILRGRHFQNRVLQRGDYITLLIENNGPGGYYTELARTMVLGKATSELRDAFAVVCEAQKYTVARLKPGAACSDIHGAHDAFMKSHGAPPERRLYGHSQGYDMVERPLLRHDETIPLAADMCVAVHPGFPTRTNFVFICDNFLIRPDGSAEPMHKVEQKIYEIE